jgi:DNA ligase-1
MTGAKQSEIKVAEEKNIGKVNYKSPEEQAEIEMDALIESKIKKGYYITLEEAKESFASGIVTIGDTNGYKPMKAQNYRDKSSKWEYPCYVQSKLNGVRAFITRVSETKVTIISGGGFEYIGFADIIKEALQLPIGVTLDGELYRHGMELSEISGIARSKKDFTRKGLLDYYCFDLVDFTLSFPNRMSTVQRLLQFNNKIMRLPTYKVSSSYQADSLYKMFVQNGYEGAIYRSLDQLYEQKRSSSMLKRKDFKDEDFLIVGYTERKGTETGAIGSFICVTDCGKEFGCAFKGSLEEKRELFLNPKSFIGKWLQIRFLNKEKGIPHCLVGLAIRDKKGG